MASDVAWVPGDAEAIVLEMRVLEMRPARSAARRARRSMSTYDLEAPESGGARLMHLPARACILFSKQLPHLYFFACARLDTGIGLLLQELLSLTGIVKNG